MLPSRGGGVGVEELDGAVGDHQRSGGELAVVLEVEEVVADLVLGEAIGWGVEVVGEFADGAEVGLLGARAEAGQLEVLEHAPAECGGRAECRGHRQVLWQRSEGNTSVKKLVSRRGPWPEIRVSARIPMARKARLSPIGWDAVLGRAQRPGLPSCRRDTLGWGSQTDKDQRSVMTIGSGMRDLRRMMHTTMRDTRAGFDIAERPRRRRESLRRWRARVIPIRYSTVGVISSSRSAEPSSGKLLRYVPTRAASEDGRAPRSRR